MSVSKTVGIFGGTFDPIHKGHMQMALDALDGLSLDEIRFVPCHQPPHRATPMLSSRQRVHLLQLAVGGHPRLRVDERELQRDEPSYTITTLDDLRSELGNDVSIVLIMGADAFAQLDTWHQWRRLRELAHIVVMARPKSVKPSSPILQQWLCQPDNESIIRQQSAGGFIQLAQSLLPISATAIRQQLCDGIDSRDIVELPEPVAAYIHTEKLYFER